MTNELTLLLDRLESEHVDVLAVVASLRPAIQDHDDVALKDALAAGEQALGPALNAHSDAEDKDLFPQIAEMIGAGLVGIFVEEHVRIRALRDQVYERIRQGQVDYHAVAEMCDLLDEHMGREDQVLFPTARGVLSG